MLPSYSRLSDLVSLVDDQSIEEEISSQGK